MPTFDVVSEVDNHEVTNAVDQATRELGTRFDFKGVNAQFELKDSVVTISTESDFQVKQMVDILHGKLIKRGIDPRSLEEGEMQVNLQQALMPLTIRQGIASDQAKKLVKIIKASKIKVQTSIQGDKIRVTGKKRDDLQSVIALLKDEKLEVPLQFENFRD